MRRVLPLLLIAAVAVPVVVQAFPSGPPDDVATTRDGCTCHGGGIPNADTVLTENFPKNYETGKAYIVSVSSTTNVVNAGTNKGGFLAWASHGKFSKPATNAAWYQLSSSDSIIKHTLDGDQGNTASTQPWTFTWTAPSTNAGAITFKLYVNRVNGINGADAGDEWNRRHITAQAPAATSPSSPSSPVSPPSSPAPSSGPRSSQPPADEPGLAAWLVLVSLAIVAVSLRRR